MCTLSQAYGKHAVSKSLLGLVLQLIGLEIAHAF